MAIVRPHPLVWLDLPVLHLSTFALGVLLARWQWLRRGRGEMEAAWKGYVVLTLAVAGVLLSATLPARFFDDNLFFTGLLAPIFAGVIWALSSTTTLVSRPALRRVAGGAGQCQLRALPDSRAGASSVQIFSLGQERDSVSGLSRGVCRAECAEFYYFETPVRLWLLERFHSRSLETTEAAAIAQ